MAWFKVDDAFFTSHKVLSIPRDRRQEAIGAWLLIGTWSAHKMTDGVVPDYVLDDFGIKESSRVMLIEAGLWIELDDGIEFHDWAEYQPTREQMTAKKEETHAKKVAAGRKGAEVRWQKDSKAIAENSKAIANDSPVPVPEPIKNTSSPTVTDFDSFWSLWPRKEGKANALKAYEKSLRKISEPELLDKARLYVTSPLRPDVKFVPHAATWLNGERWADDLVPVARVADPNDWMKSEPIVLP